MRHLFHAPLAVAGFFVLLLAGGVTADNPFNIPDCATPCVSTVLNNPDCQTADVHCVCSNKKLIASLSCCVFKNCPPAIQKKARDTAATLCEAAGVEGTIPKQASCASSGGGSGGGSSGGSGGGGGGGSGGSNDDAAAQLNPIAGGIVGGAMMGLAGLLL